MSTAEHTGPGPYRLIGWTPIAIALVLIFSMMPQREEWLYVAAVIGVVGSIAVGRTTGQFRLLSWRSRLWTFMKGWLIVIACAAVSVLHGNWQPMVFFALAGVISSGFFWLGHKTSG
jgi:hypothetical protein